MDMSVTPFGAKCTFQGETDGLPLKGAFHTFWGPAARLLIHHGGSGRLGSVPRNPCHVRVRGIPLATLGVEYVDGEHPSSKSLRELGESEENEACKITEKRGFVNGK